MDRSPCMKNDRRQMVIYRATAGPASAGPASAAPASDATGGAAVGGGSGGGGSVGAASLGDPAGSDPAGTGLESGSAHAGDGSVARPAQPRTVRAAHGQQRRDHSPALMPTKVFRRIPLHP